MSSISSQVRKIDELYFHELPAGRPVQVQKAVRVANVTVLLGKNGKLYSPSLRKRVCYGLGMWPWTDPMMRALCKMKVITPEQRDWHLAGSLERQRRSEMAHDIEMLTKSADRLGLRLTDTQQSLIKKKAES